MANENSDFTGLNYPKVVIYWDLPIENLDLLAFNKKTKIAKHSDLVWFSGIELPKVMI